jgi:hypothetical protein
MTNEQIVVIAKRFLRGFISGGIASAAALLAAGVSVTTLEDLRKLSIALAAAFITGGLLSIDKLLRWQDETTV